MYKINNLLGRLFMAQLFLMAGMNKISSYAGTQGYMESVGVPGSLLPLVILLEVGGAIAVIIGYQTRIAAYALAAFSVLSAIIFHANFADQTHMIMFMKNIAIAGGFLLLANQDTEGTISLENKLKR